MKHNRIMEIISITSLAVLLVMLNITSPTEIGPFGVLLFFTTTYIVFFGLISILFQTFKRLAFKKPNLNNKDYLYSAILAFAPIMFLIARSFGAISLWTTALIALFVFLAEFLVYKKI